MKKGNQVIATILILSIGLTAFNVSIDNVISFSYKSIENSVTLIPKSSFIIGQCDTDVSYVHAEKCRTVYVDSFYISKYEVSNGQYLDFLFDLSKTDTNLYKSMLPDTLVWRQKNYYNEPFTEYYLRHPHYRNYPVVGISYEQAEAYCFWLTKKYMAEPKRKYKNVIFKLPTNEEWVFAAKGKIDLAPFPWGVELQNKKGEWLANFRAIDQGAVGRDTLYVKSVFGGFEKKEITLTYSGTTTSSYIKNKNQLDITVPVNFYEPNGYGLYNMAGNVEEFIREKGKTHGGSWYDPGYYLKNQTVEMYDTLNSTSAERGFRFVMEIVK